MPVQNRSDGLLPGSVLCLEVAGFAAGNAVVHAIFTEANVIQALAQAAVFDAGTGPFRHFADAATKLIGHSGRLARFALRSNGRWSMTARMPRLNWGLISCRCTRSWRSIDPCKTRVVTFKVRRVSAAGSVPGYSRVGRETLCLQRWKARHSGKLRSMRCIGGWAPRWWISAVGTCRSNIPPVAAW